MVVEPRVHPVLTPVLRCKRSRSDRKLTRKSANFNDGRRAQTEASGGGTSSIIKRALTGKSSKRERAVHRASQALPCVGGSSPNATSGPGTGDGYAGQSGVAGVRPVFCYSCPGGLPSGFWSRWAFRLRFHTSARRTARIQFTVGPVYSSSSHRLGSSSMSTHFLRSCGPGNNVAMNAPSFP